MKRFISLILCLVLSLTLTACGQKEEAPVEAEPLTWQEQYDLGIRYLSEGKYEEAILAFTAAIEIDAKQPLSFIGRAEAHIASGETAETLASALADYETAVGLDETNADAWLGLADVYIRQGDYDKSLEVLREASQKVDGDKQIAEKLAEAERGSFLDSAWRVRKKTNFDELGAVVSVVEYQYNENGFESGSSTNHYEHGEIVNSTYCVVEFDQNGFPYKNLYYNGDGTLRNTYDIMVCNELGQEIERRKYSSPSSEEYVLYRYFYNELGQLIRCENHGVNGNEEGHYWEYQYNEYGRLVEERGYDEKGNLVSTASYN